MLATYPYFQGHPNADYCIDEQGARVHTCLAWSKSPFERQAFKQFLPIDSSFAFDLTL